MVKYETSKLDAVIKALYPEGAITAEEAQEASANLLRFVDILIDMKQSKRTGHDNN